VRVGWGWGWELGLGGGVDSKRLIAKLVARRHEPSLPVVQPSPTFNPNPLHPTPNPTPTPPTRKPTSGSPTPPASCRRRSCALMRSWCGSTTCWRCWGDPRAARGAAGGAAAAAAAAAVAAVAGGARRSPSGCRRRG